MAGAINYVAFLLSLLALVGVIFSTAFWEWKRSSPQSSENFLRQSYIAEGLWVRCSYPTPGQFICDTFDTALIGLSAEIQGMRAMMCLSILFGLITLFSSAVVLPCTTVEGRQKRLIAIVGGSASILSAELQGQRAMMVIATIFAVFGVIAGIMGLNCVAAMRGTKAKVWTARSGGGLMIMAGVLCLVAVSWYAANVIYEFFSILQENNPFKFEFGSALYVGWIAGGLALAAGALLACCNCSEMEDKDDSYRYTYRPPQSNKPNAKPAEYV